MVIARVVEGDLLTAPIIAHQCNCITTRGKGLSYDIFARFPYANVYAGGPLRVPGTIEVRKGPTVVVALYGQYLPGKIPGEPRLGWFRQCLMELEKWAIAEIAMPYGIGCGLAGGRWEDYEAALQKSTLSIVLYRKQ